MGFHLSFSESLSKKDGDPIDLITGETLCRVGGQFKIDNYTYKDFGELGEFFYSNISESVEMDLRLYFDEWGSIKDTVLILLYYYYNKYPNGCVKIL